MGTTSEFVGIPIVVALFGGIVAAFTALDRWSSKEARRSLAIYLKTTNFPALSKKLPQATLELFNRIFGQRHFSFQALRSSSVVSLVGILVFMLAAFVLGFSKPWLTSEQNISYWESYFANPEAMISFIYWIGWSFAIDYVMLYKTRVVLKILAKRSISIILSIFLLLIDVVVGVIVFVIGVSVMFVMTSITFGASLRVGVIEDTFLKLLAPVLLLLLRPTSDSLWLIYISTLKPSLPGLSNVMFYAGLLPSIWLWLYIFSAVITKLALKFAPSIRFVVFFLDVDEHPIQSVGIVAASTVTAAYLVSLLISSLTG